MIGAVAGFLAGYLGIGGGLILVPALTWLFSRDPATADLAVHQAVATSLATMLVTSLSSLVAHHRRGAIAWTIVRQYLPGLCAGAAGGAVLADRLQTAQLAAAFGVFALVAGIQLMAGRTPRRERPLPGRAASLAVATGIGCVSALVGIGGGSLTAPWLMAHGHRAQRAIATAAACGYPIALTGSLAFLWLGGGFSAPGAALGYVNLPAFAGIVVTSALAAPVGAAAVHGSRPEWVRRGFGLFLLVVAARMLLL